MRRVTLFVNGTSKNGKVGNNYVGLFPLELGPLLFPLCPPTSRLTLNVPEPANLRINTIKVNLTLHDALW